MSTLDWLIVLILNGAVIGVGVYLARGTSTSGEWFLGSRALPWWGVGLSMFATNVDNADLVSVTGKTYSEGLHILTVYAIGSAAGGILAAFFIVPKMYRAGFFTNAEYLEARFGPSGRVLSALIQIQYRSSMLGLMIWSVYLLLTGLNIVAPVQAWILIVILVVCAGLYTAWGGLKSVVWTDACQAVIMMVGGIVIFATVWNVAGGWSGVTGELARTNQTDLLHIGQFDGGSGTTTPYTFSIGDSSLRLGPLVVVLGWTIIGSGYWTVNHTQTMRLMGTRSLWDAKMAAVFGVAASLPIMIACACLGVLGRAIPATASIDDPNLLYPHLAREYLGVGLKGLVVASIVSAAISTFDSMGSALSSIFTRDIYARFLVKDRDDAHYVLVGRIATVGILMLGFLYLPFIAMQKDMLDAFTTLIPVFVTPLFTMYLAGVFTRAHRKSGMIGLVCGSLFGMFALYCREAPRIDMLPEIAGVPAWLTGRWGALILTFCITAAGTAVATLVYGRDDGTVEAFEETGWLQRSREDLPPLRESPFETGTPSWLNPAWYAAGLMIVMLYVVFGLFW